LGISLIIMALAGVFLDLRVTGVHTSSSAITQFRADPRCARA